MDSTSEHEGWLGLGPGRIGQVAVERGPFRAVGLDDLQRRATGLLGSDSNAGENGCDACWYCVHALLVGSKIHVQKWLGHC